MTISSGANSIKPMLFKDFSIFCASFETKLIVFPDSVDSRLQRLRERTYKITKKNKIQRILTRSCMHVLSGLYLDHNGIFGALEVEIFTCPLTIFETRSLPNYQTAAKNWLLYNHA